MGIFLFVFQNGSCRYFKLYFDADLIIFECYFVTQIKLLISHLLEERTIYF